MAGPITMGCVYFSHVTSTNVKLRFPGQCYPMEKYLECVDKVTWKDPIRESAEARGQKGNKQATIRVILVCTLQKIAAMLLFRLGLPVPSWLLPKSFC